MLGVNHYMRKMKGAFECKFERWAYAKKGGTAENFRPFEDRAFFIL